MVDERRRRVLAAAIAGLIGLGGIAALVKADEDRERAAQRAAPGGGGGPGYDDRVDVERPSDERGYDARGAGLDAPAPDEPVRRSMDDDYAAVDREDAREGAREVGPAIVGPKIVGPKRVGPKRVGPKIVGPRLVGPARTTRYQGGGGGARVRVRADHLHYPPGWTRTPRQGPGRTVAP